MADINKLKDKIKSTIYPNGKGAINASDHQAMLLEMADGMADTDTKLAELSLHVEFSVQANIPHSSDNDRVKCDIAQGSMFYVNYKTNGEVTYIYPIVTYEDGTTEQFAVPTERYFVASKTIKEIGYYIPGTTIVKSGQIDVLLSYGNSLAHTTQDAFMKAEGYEVRYIWLKSGVGHSSTKDKFAVSLKKGDSFNLKLVNIGSDVRKFGVGVQYVGENDTTIISTGLSVDEAHTLVVQEDIDAIGIYVDISYFSETGVVAAYLSFSDSLQDDVIIRNAFTGIYNKANTQDALLRYAEKLKEVKGLSENFIFFSDPHLVGSNNQFPEMSFKESIGTLQKYYNSAPIDHVICGGDWLQAGDTQDYAMWKLGMIDATMNKLFKGYLPLLGNHDTNYQGYVSDTDQTRGDLSQEQITNVMFRKFGKPYYSYQARASKFIMLDTQIDWESGMTSYKWEQIDWYGNLLLDNIDDNIIVFMHIYYNDGDIVNAMAQNVCNMAAAFNNRTSITLNGKTYNFRGAKGSIRCIVAGHSHYDEVTLNTDIPVVLTTTFNSDKGATFDMCSADFEKGKLYMTRVGEGADRVVALFK